MIQDLPPQKPIIEHHFFIEKGKSSYTRDIIKDVQRKFDRPLLHLKHATEDHVASSKKKKKILKMVKKARILVRKAIKMYFDETVME